MKYRINILVEPYKGDLIEDSNKFTLKKARYLQNRLYELLYNNWANNEGKTKRK